MADLNTRWRVISMLLVITAISCAWPTEGCGCSPAPQHELPVAGVVLRANGVPASSAVIRAVAFAGACPVSDSGARDDTQAFDISDANGRFYFSVRAFQSIPDACIRVRYYADTTLGASPAGRTDYPGRKVVLRNAGRPVDSLQLTITLP